MKKAVVTGANGFVGSAVCKRLTQDGVAVIAVVRSEKSDISNLALLKNVKVVYCDLSDIKMLPQIISDSDIDVFFHFAWEGTAGPLRGNIEVQMNNIKYTCDAVCACAEMRCGRFVFASSIMEYEIEALMKTNSMPAVNTLYSSAKVSADYLARTLAGAMGVAYIRAVISNVYGPGEKSPRLINTSIRKWLNGEHCSFSAGEQMYDFIYIDDAAECFMAIGNSGIANKTYYIGSLKPRPLKDFLKEMYDQIAPNVHIGLGELPYNGIFLKYDEFDIRAVYKDTGFVPRVEFKQGVQYTADWIKEMG